MAMAKETHTNHHHHHHLRKSSMSAIRCSVPWRRRTVRFLVVMMTMMMMMMMMMMAMISGGVSSREGVRSNGRTGSGGGGGGGFVVALSTAAAAAAKRCSVRCSVSRERVVCRHWSDSMANTNRITQLALTGGGSSSSSSSPFSDAMSLPQQPPPPSFTTRTTTTRTTATTTAAADALVESGPFPRTWVPLASVYELDGSRPNAVSFLNQNYVVYQANTGRNNNSRKSSSSSSRKSSRNAKATASPSNTNNNNWVVADATCPHRLAPLSEGRVVPETGQLECAYHGWTFDAQGLCTRIPQWSSSSSRSSSNGGGIGTDDSGKGGTTTTTSTTTAALPVCRLPTYPCVVEKNILWAWLWPSDPLAVPTTQEDRDSIPLHATLPEYFLANIAPDTSTYTLDVPYSYDTLLENIVDPSHVPFAHHGLQGTRQDAIPIQMSRPTHILPTGFNFTFADRTMRRHRIGTGVFRAPFVISYAAEFVADANETTTAAVAGRGRHRSKTTAAAQRKTFNLTTILIPTRPGWSRIIIFGSAPTPAAAAATVATNGTDSTVATVKTIKRPSKSLFARVMQVLPIWLLHQLSSLFLDSDLVFLHCQERERERRLLMQRPPSDMATNDKGSAATAAAALRRVYFMPAQADRCVVALRQWIHQYAHVMGPLPPLETNRRILFDRWAQHSEQCRHCNQAASNLKQWRNRTYGVLVGSVLVMHRFLLARIAIVGCIGLLRLYHMIDTNLRQGEFQHYKNH